MKLHRMYRFMLLLATGGALFQTTTSCTSELANTVSGTAQTAIVDAVNQVVTAYLNEFLSGTA